MKFPPGSKVLSIADTVHANTFCKRPPSGARGTAEQAAFGNPPVSGWPGVVLVVAAAASGILVLQRRARTAK